MSLQRSKGVCKGSSISTQDPTKILKDYSLQCLGKSFKVFLHLKIIY